MNENTTSLLWNLSGESIVDLFELDATNLTIPIMRFHGHTGNDIIWWQGVEYQGWAIKATDFNRNGKGNQPRPKLSISNVGKEASSGNVVVGVFSRLCLATNDLIGAKLIRHRTLVRYLDANNFPEGNPTADPSESFGDEIWLIDRKVEETNEIISFELVSPLDFGQHKIPNRIMGATFFQPQGQVK